MPAKTLSASNEAINLNEFKGNDSEFKGVGTSNTSWDKKNYTPKIITQKQYQDIKKEIPNTLKKRKWLSLYYETLFDTIRYTGLRLNVVLDLKTTDLHPEEQFVVVNKQKNGRVHELQPAPKDLFKQIYNHIEEYKEYIEKNDGHLFFSRYHGNKRITRNGVNMFLARMRQRSNLPILNKVYGYSKDGRPLHIFSFHTLRHLYITEAVHKLGLAAAKELAGHKYLESTLRYTHINIMDKVKYVNQLYDQNNAQKPA